MIPKLTGKYRAATIIVTMPLPPRILTGNGITGANPNAVASARAHQHRDAERALRSALGHYDAPDWPDIYAIARFYFKTLGRHDDDNHVFALKAARDAMAAMFGIDDSHWRWGVCEIQKDKRDPRVEIRIRQWESGLPLDWGNDALPTPVADVRAMQQLSRKLSKPIT